MIKEWREKAQVNNSFAKKRQYDWNMLSLKEILGDVYEQFYANTVERLQKD